MKYSFEYKEIKSCRDCPICLWLEIGRSDTICHILEVDNDNERLGGEKLKNCPLTIV